VIVGDFNTDPSYSSSRGGDRFFRMKTSGWAHAAPAGASYWTLRGAPKQLDHGFISPRLKTRRAEYVTRVGDQVLAHGTAALSDHAALLIEVALS
jgi:endonuclease/exonuclease/phosphatase family metal-dependent hydrolase